jgi:hypothetical protein
MWSTADVAVSELFAALLSGTHEDPAQPGFVRTGVACFARPGAPPERVCVQVFAGDR